MKYAEFDKAHTDWVDEFVSKHDRGPETYQEFIQFVMDELVDGGKI